MSASAAATAAATASSSSSSSSSTPQRKRKRKQKMPGASQKAKYRRSEATTAKRSKKIKDKKLKREMRELEAQFEDAAESTARTEILLAEEAGFLEAEDMEETWRFTQDALAPHVDNRTRDKMFELELGELGPYNLDFTPNGRMLLLGGRKGHLALMNWSKFSLKTEFHVRETVRDVQFLHDHTMFAVAQKKWTYIYDSTGVELHSLRHHVEVNRLDYLRYHWLLVTVGKPGLLQYQDTSTGAIVARHRTRMGPVDAMTHNPRNAVVHLGHGNGQVTLWTPNVTTPVVKMLAHHAPVQALAVDPTGLYMATSGLDGQVKVWDIRNYKCLHSYYSVRPASTMDISQRGLLALGCGPHVQVWKDALVSKAKAPYMVHRLPGKAVRGVRFCPYEDVLGVSHSGGFCSVVVPGAGEANYDSLEANPFETKAQRRESTVHRLLDKLQPSMIALDPDSVASVDNAAPEVLQKEKTERRNAELAAAIAAASKPGKKRARGRSSSLRRFLRKRKNIVDKKKQMREDEIAKRKHEAAKAKRAAQRAKRGQAEASALDRFSKYG